MTGSGLLSGLGTSHESLGQYCLTSPSSSHIRAQDCLPWGAPTPPPMQKLHGLPHGDSGDAEATLVPFPGTYAAAGSRPPAPDTAVLGGDTAVLGVAEAQCFQVEPWEGQAALQNARTGLDRGSFLPVHHLFLTPIYIPPCQSPRR